MNNLPYLTKELPGIGGTIKQRPEDFRVDEIPLYDPCGEGTHTYIRIEKRDITTHQAVKFIARHLDRRPQEIGFAGIKDARAVTTQTLSVEHIDKHQLDHFHHDNIRILHTAFHTNKIKTGHLAGNKFRIRLRETDPEPIEPAMKILEVLENRGVPNFFGPQRFGTRGDTAQLGQAILAGKADNSIHHLDKKMKRLYISAYQSWIFNEILARRIDSIDRILPGDIAKKSDTGGIFHVQDPVAEQLRADRFEISPTGLLPGYRTDIATAAAGEIEQSVLDAHNLDPASIRKAGSLKIPGTRRSLRFRPDQAIVTPGRDVHGEYMEVEFSAPAGSYATVLVREITK